MSLRDKILAAQDLRHEDVTVDAWGVTVRVRTVPGSEVVAWSAAQFDESGKPRPADDRMARIVQLCVVDPETGEPVFSLDDLEQLRGKSASVVAQLAGLALVLNGSKPAKN